MTIDEVFANCEPEDIIELTAIYFSFCNHCQQYIEEVSPNSDFRGTKDDYDEFKAGCIAYEDTDEIEQIDENCYRVIYRSRDDDYICDKCSERIRDNSNVQTEEDWKFLCRILPKQFLYILTPEVIKAQEDYEHMYSLLSEIRQHGLKHVGRYKITWGKTMIDTEYGQLKAAKFRLYSAKRED